MSESKTAEQVAADYRREKNKELLIAAAWAAGLFVGIYVVSKLIK